MADESRVFRQRLESLRDRADRLSAGSPGTDVMVGQVYNGGAGIPTTVPNQFAVHSVTVTGQECEGCTPTITADASSKAIFTVLGGKVPVAGDNLVARVVGGRWVADRIKAVTTVCGNICVQVKSACSGNPAINGATVTVAGPGANDTCTTTGTVGGLGASVQGSGYVTPPSVTIGAPPAGGTQAAATANLGAVGVTAITLTSGGSGYTAIPTVTFSGGGGSGATATAKLVATSIGSATVTNAGSGYTSPPSVQFTVGFGQTGSGATATTTIVGGQVTAINITNGGSNYSAPPGLSIFGGNGTGATGTANLAPTSVASVTRNNAGSGYTSAPTVVFSGGGGGSGAAATATVGGPVQSYTMTNKGSGYLSAPTVTVGAPPSGGTQATATASLVVQCCIPITASGTYTITAAADRFAGTTFTVSLATCADSNQSTNLNPAPGYQCTANVCCPTSLQSGPPYPVITYPGTLTLGDGFGNVTLTKGTGAGTYYTGYATRTAGHGYGACPDPATSPYPDPSLDVAVPVMFYLLCNNNATWALSVNNNACNLSTSPTTVSCNYRYPCDGPYDTLQWCGGSSLGSSQGATSQPVQPTSCNPLTLVIPLVFALTNLDGSTSPTAGLVEIYGTSPVNYTITG